MTTTNLALTLPTVGGDADAWGTELNADLGLIDAAFDVTTPTLTDGSGAGLTLTVTAAKSGKLGPHCGFLAFNVTYPSTANGAVATISGNPLAPLANLSIPALAHCNASASVGSPIFARVVAGGATVEIYNATSGVQITNAQMSTGFIRCFITFAI